MKKVLLNFLKLLFDALEFMSIAVFTVLVILALNAEPFLIKNALWFKIISLIVLTVIWIYLHRIYPALKRAICFNISPPKDKNESS